jgi:hypothetical protein
MIIYKLINNLYILHSIYLLKSNNLKINFIKMIIININNNYINNNLNYNLNNIHILITITINIINNNLFINNNNNN